MARDAPFPILDVDAWAWEMDEPMGKPGKRWLSDPAGLRWLWKPVTEQHDPAGDFAKGEDWAEKLTAELARLLDVPAAVAELAVLRDRPGVIVANVAPPGWDLVHGNELLVAVVDGYGAETRQEVPGYNLDAIDTAFTDFSVGPPPGPTGGDAMSVFVWYLALDALIANTDRHHTNWGVLHHVDDGAMTLCPSYDHATSLGFQLSDDARRRLLDQPGGVPAFARRARSRPFEGRPGLAELLRAGLVLRPDAAGRVGDALGRLGVAEIVALVDRLPEVRMSQVCRRFVTEMLTVNRERVLDACNHDRP